MNPKPTPLVSLESAPPTAHSTRDTPPSIDNATSLMVGVLVTLIVAGFTFFGIARSTVLAVLCLAAALLLSECVLWRILSRRNWPATRLFAAMALLAAASLAGFFAPQGNFIQP